LSRFHLLLLIHAHQPVGNFADVLERAYANSYRPFVELLRRHPSIRVGLHYSGPLLEWFAQNHPDFFDLVRELIRRNQVELVGGGFYEPILIAIPAEDRQEQILRMADFIEKHFGRRPRGAWLAERVWEPQLPSSLAQAGVAYTLVDDIHFLASGFELEQLHGYYVAEDQGATVKVIPGLKALRYLIPYRSLEENIAFLRAAAQAHPGGFAAMGDDCEKFGVWPGTCKHCYTDGWLERFFAALEANSDWLAVTPPGEYLAHNLLLGRADLPTASYTELTEWALPNPVRQRFQALQHEFAGRPDLLAFLRGSFWRNFLSKYPEANLLHKKMLHVSEKVRRMGARRQPGSRKAPYPAVAGGKAFQEATTRVLRAQCNDAYWHGIFGGIYAPHLRTALWRELVQAEKAADGSAHGRGEYSAVTRLDFDADGREELYLVSDRYAALVKPSDGGTLAALDFRPADVTLVNSIQRRAEPYHARLREARTGEAGGLVSIHEQVRVKEEGLERRLRYDRWPRHSFRLLLFSPEKTYEDYEAVRLEESAGFAGGAYEVSKAAKDDVRLWREAPLEFARDPADGGGLVKASKMFLFRKARKELAVACNLTLSHRGTARLPLQVGVEVIVNLLAPDQPDRYFETRDGRHPLRWGGVLPASELRIVDEWQNVAVTVQAQGTHTLWVAPVETISESEEGFERVYQGSEILAVWPVELNPGAVWNGNVVLRVAPAR